MGEKMEVVNYEHGARHEHPTTIELHHDQVAPEAIGGLQKDLPAHYYR